MKNAGPFIALVSLFLAAIPCRAEDPAVAAKCLTLQQRLAEWGKVRQVSQPTPMPAAEAISPPANGEPLPPPTRVGEPIPSMVPAQPSCLSGPGHRPCWAQLDDWLTYRPLKQNCCDCFPKAEPCCSPPLYAFFIGNCCIQPVAPDYHGAPGHRLGCLWERMHHCQLWPGNVCVHVRQGLSGFFFSLGESCAVHDGTIAETQN
jgi:hypothetical protein